MITILPKILCVTRFAGFWTTPVCRQYFPKLVFLPARPTRWQYLTGTVRALFHVLREQPDVLLCGTSTKLPVLFATLRKWGIFRRMRIVTDCQFMHLYDLSFVDRVIVYSPEEIALFTERWRVKITPLWWPSKRELVTVSIRDEGYIFAGGNHLRDHDTFLRAMEKYPIPTVLYTSNTVTVPMPTYVQRYTQAPLQEYLESMAGAHFVVIPLQGDVTTPHGHCDISTALSMGKIVVTTRGATADSYIEEGHNGILVAPGSVEEYQKAVAMLMQDAKIYTTMSKYAQEHAAQYQYEAYAKKVYAICNEVAVS